MVEIIPAINAKTFAEIEQKIKLVEPHVNWVHIDVTDGSFTDVVLWHNPEELLNLHTPLFIELHLMLEDIDTKIEDWLLPNVRRNIVHIEACRNPKTVIDACHGSDIQIGMAVRPETPCSHLFPIASEVDLLQTLAVHPGPSGQKFDVDTLKKIEELRTKYPGMPIEVDGGVNAEVAGQVRQAGASIIVAAAAIFNAENIEQAIAALQSK
jgi:ribulose-phosphate 3-epimerase